MLLNTITAAQALRFLSETGFYSVLRAADDRFTVQEMFSLATLGTFDRPGLIAFAQSKADMLGAAL